MWFSYLFISHFNKYGFMFLSMLGSFLSVSVSLDWIIANWICSFNYLFVVIIVVSIVIDMIDVILYVPMSCMYREDFIHLSGLCIFQNNLWYWFYVVFTIFFIERALGYNTPPSMCDWGCTCSPKASILSPFLLGISILEPYNSLELVLSPFLLPLCPICPDLLQI